MRLRPDTGLALLGISALLGAGCGADGTGIPSVIFDFAGATPADMTGAGPPPDLAMAGPMDLTVPSSKFSFFVVSMRAIIQLSGSNAGFGGDHPNTVTVGDTTGWGHSETLTATILIESVPLCSGPDLDCDGAVDGGDLATLLSTWGDAACRTDLDGDGVTGSGDLAILLAAWG